MSEPLFSLTVPAAAERIQARQPHINAFVSTRLPDARREHAERSAEPRRSPLHGAPFSLKDEWETTCLPTTGGSWRHRERRAAADCPALGAFADAGAILVGKTNLSDYGLVPESSSWVGGTTRNPLDPSRTAGGSSGGAAAAVADGQVAFDWGTDIGGSIRLPAGHCGVHGLRLSSETWPVTGMFPAAPAPLAWMLAQGPITRTLDQLAGVLDVAEAKLRTGAQRGPFHPREAVLYTMSGGAWPTFTAELAPHLRRALGTVRTDHELLPTDRARWLYNAVWCSHLDELLTVDPEFTLTSGVLAVLSAVFLRGRFGDKRFHPATAEVLLQVALGRLTLFRDKARALAGARAYRDGFQRIWDRGGVVVMPVCAWPAARHGTSTRNPRILECTMPGNLVDATALAVPWGRFADGLPRAIQLMGPPGSERALIELARSLASRQS